ncbi:dTDP-4-dehydrorhamnose 3,5-epimerase [Flavobacterium sp. Sd200]|uniref:dTDP-4-dehydrorhamnose 3,5-epimerase n=1 Tax=Flavobacterium sp. Sd200 TaxID=2692211 RepID=UPI00136B73E9|nr:dTDP-4-dehydrorhamnose 3,5-epimerase [Flavobacterium sp. Sd200]MXN92569.1 dTDP-4-dehydrorhamnose 3,5-epimerase [Flavobacterium sp. Sd200]
MTFTPTHLDGCFIIEPNVIKDSRGYFMESFNLERFEKGTGFKVNFVQDNQSFSTKGVLRGLHYQTGTFAQAKLVRVLEGEVLDVAVDIRPESKTYGQYVSVVLSAQNHKQLFIPRGFAHGFLVLSDTATFFYKCDNLYNKESEGGIMYNDPAIDINWEMDASNLIISDKDLLLPNLENSKKIW